MYVVLEIADSDFKKLFRSSVYLSEAHIKMLLYNLLVGVKFVHSAGILHRDLVGRKTQENPSARLLNPINPYLHLKIASLSRRHREKEA